MEEAHKDVPNVAMGVILNAGDGRELIDKAFDSMSDLDLASAEGYLEQADEKILAAHRLQTEMIQREASGERIEFSILFVHAQDTLMTVSSELHMARRMVPLVRTLLNKACLEANELDESTRTN